MEQEKNENTFATSGNRRKCVCFVGPAAVSGVSEGVLDRICSICGFTLYPDFCAVTIRARALGQGIGLHRYFPCVALAGR